MKSFVLTPNSMGLFIKRFDSMLERKMCLKVYSVYSGKKREYNVMKQALENSNKKDEDAIIMGRILLPVVRTSDTYIVEEKITCRWVITNDYSGITMSISGGNFIYIPFGVKIFGCSEKFYFKQPQRKTLPAHTTYIVGSSYAKGINEIEWNELYERDYAMDFF